MKCELCGAEVGSGDCPTCSGIENRTKIEGLIKHWESVRVRFDKDDQGK